MAEEFNNIVKRLQDEMRYFLHNTVLEINGVTICPYEIEAYYYKEGEFEDCYVHCNDMQKVEHKGHFYVHRKGKSEQDAYTGGNRCCLDYVVGEKGAYFSFLLRSASVESNGKSELYIKPNILLNIILTATGLGNKDLEKTKIDVKKKKNNDRVFFSTRFGLSGDGKFANALLRAVRNGPHLKQGYPGKEKIAYDHYIRLKNGLNEDDIKDEIREIFGYLPPIKQHL